MHVDLPIYETLQRLGFALLSLAIVVNAAREALKLLQGQAADWVSLILKSLLSVCILAAIPTIGRTIVGVSVGIGNGLLEQAQAPLMEKSFAAAFSSFDCPTGWSVTRTLFAGLANVALFMSLLAKLFIIDIGWTIALHFVLYLGVLSLPASLFGGGGVGGYLRSLWSVASWPIIFAIIVSVISGMFPRDFQAVAEGRAKIDCTRVEQLREGAGANLGTKTPDYSRDTGTKRYGYALEKSGMWEGLRFIGLLAVLIVMQLSIPYLGMLAAGETSPGNMMGNMMGGAAKGRKGASMAKAGTSAAAGGIAQGGAAVKKVVSKLSGR